MPNLQERIENGLNETRILILGAQVLLGFNFRSVFEKSFERLEPASRDLKLASLGLMLFATGLLISPASYHRIVEEGADSGKFHRFISVVTELALLPFAVALAVDLGIATGRATGGGFAVVPAAGALFFALLLWWGVEIAWRTAHGKRALPRRAAQSEGRRIMPEIGEKIQNVLTETRVVLPGAQALLGFQFISTLSEGYEKLPQAVKMVHLGSLGAICVSIVLLMTPAAWHRIAEEGEDSERFHRLTGRYLLTALLFLGLGLAGDVYVVGVAAAKDPTLALAAAAATLAVLWGLWFLLPFSRRVRVAAEKRARRRVTA
ncbi:MAG TPA: DUF6328 family protein [Thermoanaerobaculia bacterium]|nr:DUF6328 family protein [Thermoanaerobaculia bacterium]